MMHTTWRVMYAVMLRDLRTRFFNHGLGYLVTIAFPLVHIVIIITTYSFFGRNAPFGRDAPLFFATGFAPFMAWMYMSRYIMLSGLMNRPLLAFPVVTVLDLFLGRGILEALGTCCTALLLIGLGLMLGYDIRPNDPTDAALCWIVALALGIGFGIFNGVIAMVNVGWVTVFILTQIIFYFSSGTIFTPSELPTLVLDILYWVPTIHLVEWMRAAWFEGYPDTILDRTYVTIWAIGSIFCSLILERVARRRLLEA